MYWVYCLQLSFFFLISVIYGWHKPRVSSWTDACESRQSEGLVRPWVWSKDQKGNRDLGSCELAVRLLFFKTSKPCQGQERRERCVESSVGLWSKYSSAKIVWRVSCGSVRAGDLRCLSMEGLRMLRMSELCKGSWLKCDVERSLENARKFISCKGACGGVRSDLSSATKQLLHWWLLP